LKTKEVSRLKKTQQNMEMIILLGIVLLILTATDCLVIQPTWNHLRLKKVAPARIDGRLTGEVELVCSATGSPAPAVAWYKDSLFVPHLELETGDGDGHASIGETVARLRLPCLTQKDAGQYECRARAGKLEVSAVTEVNVVPFDSNMCAELGEPEIVMWRPTVMVEEGLTAVLPCRAKDKHTSVTWTSSSGEKISGERMRVLKNGDLVIKDLAFPDMGEYTCTAINSKGHTSVSSFIYPLAPGGRNMV